MTSRAPRPPSCILLHHNLSVADTLLLDNLGEPDAGGGRRLMQDPVFTARGDTVSRHCLHPSLRATAVKNYGIARMIDAITLGQDWRPYTECPLSLEPFKTPVQAKDTHTYELEMLRRSIQHSQTSPLTREPLAAAQSCEVAVLYNAKLAMLCRLAQGLAPDAVDMPEQLHLNLSPAASQQVIIDVRTGQAHPMWTLRVSQIAGAIFAGTSIGLVLIGAPLLVPGQTMLGLLPYALAAGLLMGLGGILATDLVIHSLFVR